MKRAKFLQWASTGSDLSARANMTPARANRLLPGKERNRTSLAQTSLGLARASELLGGSVRANPGSVLGIVFVLDWSGLRCRSPLNTP